MEPITEHLNILTQSIQQSFRYFNLKQNGGPTDIYIYNCDVSMTNHSDNQNRILHYQFLL